MNPPGAGEAVDPRLGEVISDRYRIVDKIGRGGMGAIYLAEHVITGKRVAVKTLLPGLGRVPEIVKRFEREARAASLLAHPNIVAVLDFGALADGALYLVMELVAGRPLGDVMEAGPVGSERAFAITRQVLEALAHAHVQGVIHRDLKPDNIMLVDAGDSAEERDIVKLLDFGIAKMVGDAAQAEDGAEKLTQAGVAFGTPDYMSPEQALGEEVDARADLYSVGVILFELLTGKKPFENSDKVAVLRMHVAVDPPRLADLAPGLAFAREAERLVVHALAKRRVERFAGAEAMIAALDGAAAAQAALVSPASPARPAGRAFYLLVAGAAIAILLGLLLGRGSGPRDGSRPPLAPLLPFPAAPPAPPGKAERDLRAEKLLAAGDAAGAEKLLEGALGSADADADPWTFLILGHARILLDKPDEALAAYDRGLALAPALASDPPLKANLDLLLGRNKPRVALAALDLVARRFGDPGRAVIVDQASRGKVPAVRKRARELAAERHLDGVDLVSSYGLDLAQGQGCKERKEAIPVLRALRDKRAIPALKKAIGRGGGFLDLSNINACLDKDAQEAMEFLQALP